MPEPLTEDDVRAIASETMRSDTQVREAFAIVTQLAVSPEPLALNGVLLSCRLCAAVVEQSGDSLELHEEECPWRLAVEWQRRA